jgi:antitoxin component of MazEF toxin-antitoxin module
VAGEVGFLPVQVAAERGAESGHSIEIVLGGDRLVRVPAGFDRRTLLDVLAALEGRGC